MMCHRRWVPCLGLVLGAAGGNHSLALVDYHDPSVSVMPQDQSGEYCVVVANSVGAVTSKAARLTVREAVLWGNTGGGLGEIPEGATNLVDLASGSGHLVGLREDGQVLAWGNNSAGQSVVSAAATNAIHVAARVDRSLALRRDGTVVAWGNNALGQAAVPPEATNVIAVAAGPVDCGCVGWRHGTCPGCRRNGRAVDHRATVLPTARARGRVGSPRSFCGGRPASVPVAAQRSRSAQCH